MRAGKGKRKDDRKFKRIRVRYGPEKPVHLAYAIQVSVSGAFLVANRPVFSPKSPLLVQFDTPDGVLTTRAIVRHVKNLPPQLARFSPSGMGVEFISPPPELEKYLASL